MNLLDMATEWRVSTNEEGTYEGRDRETGELKWTGTALSKVHSW